MGTVCHYKYVFFSVLKHLLLRDSRNETLISLAIDLVYQILIYGYFSLKPSYFKKLVPCFENML